MSFTTIIFALFLAVVFGTYWLMPARWNRMRNLFLLVSSYGFYSCFDYRFLFVLLAISTSDYLIGRAIERTLSASNRKWWLGAALTIDIGALVYFKYTNFFIESAQQFFTMIGWQGTSSTIQILLPVGISFYIFRSMTYTIDVYRKEITAATQPLDYFLFVAFFPQLTSGPIERARNFLPQISRVRVFETERIKDGLRQILWGYFKKVVFADNLAVLVDPVFSDPTSGSPIVAAVLYSFQIYCDFSGYTDIAIGTATLFGFRSVANFRTPYFSRNIAEFWRRWHISLTSWLFEYIYAPLAGLKPSKLRRSLVILVVFLTSGLWHGANWTFIVWGMLHGIFYLPLVMEERTNPDSKHAIVGRWGLPKLSDLGRMLLTFGLVTFAWVVFRADSLTNAFHFVREAVAFHHISPTLIQTGWLFGCLGLLSWEWIFRKKRYLFDLTRFPVTIRWSIYLALILIYCLFGKFDSGKFVYMQF